MNSQNRVGGFSPAQWVLGRNPRHGPGEQGDSEGHFSLSAMEEIVDPQVETVELLEDSEVECWRTDLVTVERKIPK